MLHSSPHLDEEKISRGFSVKEKIGWNEEEGRKERVEKLDAKEHETMTSSPLFLYRRERKYMNINNPCVNPYKSQSGWKYAYNETHGWWWRERFLGSPSWLNPKKGVYQVAMALWCVCMPQKPLRWWWALITLTHTAEHHDESFLALFSFLPFKINYQQEQ